MKKRLAYLLTVGALLFTAANVRAQDMTDPNLIHRDDNTITQPALTAAEAQALFVKGTNAMHVDIAQFSTGKQFQAAATNAFDSHSNMAVSQDINSNQNLNNQNLDQDLNREGVSAQSDLENPGVIENTGERSTIDQKSESQFGDHNTAVSNDMNSNDVNNDVNVDQQSDMSKSSVSQSDQNQDLKSNDNTVRKDFTLQPEPSTTQQSMDVNKSTTTTTTKSKRVRLAKD
jgi:hypothetical protein